MSESAMPPVDNGSKGDDFGDKADTLTQSNLLTDFEASASMDSDERYLVRRGRGGLCR